MPSDLRRQISDCVSYDIIPFCSWIACFASLVVVVLYVRSPRRKVHPYVIDEAINGGSLMNANNGKRLLARGSSHRVIVEKFPYLVTRQFRDS
jgi:hypothetical protein